MITSRFINFFLIFLMVNFLVIGAINSELKNIKFLSFMGCVLSIMFIISICFFPLPYQDELLESMISSNQGFTNNFIPFRSILSIFNDTIQYHVYSELCYQLFGNIILFMPLGFSLFFYLKNNRKFLRMMCYVLFVTIFVEAQQGVFNLLLQVNYRSVDIDDIILNFIGGILGFCFASSALPIIKKLLVKIKK